MRVNIDGVEYVSGYDFEEEFLAVGNPGGARGWREEGMPYKCAEELGLEAHGSKFYYPVEAGHAWFRGEEEVTI